MAGGSGCALSRAEPAAVLPIYASLLSRERLNVLLCQSGQRLYWRTLTPLIMLWGMLYQRLHHDHTCDAAVSYLRSGAVDDLDGQDPHGQPLSQRLRSESTAAYVQGRNRLPLTLVQAASQWVAHQVLSWSQDSPQGTAQPYWHGRAVRVLDGTTFRLRPHGDLAQTYGQAHNGQGCSYWVVAKSLVSFCLYRQVCIGYAEGSQQSSEPGLFRQVVQQDPVAQSIYIADQGLGVYRVAQVACHYGHDVVLRLEQRVAQRLLRLAGGPPLHDHQERPLVWQPAPTAVVEPDWPIQPIAGRVLYIRVEPAGFRPFDVYLFTTLTDARRYSLAEIAALYGLRWRGELDLRHIKTVMQMEEFTVQSAALFRKELAVGLLAYNLVCALMTQAALQAGVCPAQLSFSCCLRRIAMFLCYGMPAWVNAQSNPLTYLLSELAGCRLPVQPQKTHHEPRRVRRRQSTYPPLLGNRDAARRQWLEEMA
jgi:hypothetical protein